MPVAVSYTVLEASANGSANGAKPKTLNVTFDTDEGPRTDTSIEALAKLKPAFHARGVVTAGNSSQMSDGAAASVVMSADRARAVGPEAAGAFRRVRHGRVSAGRDGHRPGVRDSEGAQDRGSQGSIKLT